MDGPLLGVVHEADLGALDRDDVVPVHVEVHAEGLDPVVVPVGPPHSDWLSLA